MWAVLMDYFRRYPAQEKIAKQLIQYGLRIRDGRIFAGEIEISDSSLARAAGVDRRIVSATVKTIQSNAQLAKVFANFQPTCHLKDVAPVLNWGVLEIVPEDAGMPGILSGVSGVIASRNISIRQAIVDDPDFIEEPKLFVVTEAPVPADIIPEVQRVKGVKSVTVY